MGIAFSQTDDTAAVAALRAGLHVPDARVDAIRRYVSCLPSVDDGTRHRALDLLARLDGETAVASGRSGLAR